MTKTTVESLAPLEREDFRISVTGPRRLALTGQIAMRDPVREIGPHLEAIHEAACGGGELTVDLTQLKYMNSSGIKLFLDWVQRLKRTPEETRYRLRIEYDPGLTWQRAALPAIRALAAGLAVVEGVKTGGGA